MVNNVENNQKGLSFEKIWFKRGPLASYEYKVGSFKGGPFQLSRCLDS